MDIEFAVKNNMNVLLIGKHGVGKTTRPRAYMEANKIPYLFFNCPTMDVYEDLRGFPIERDGKIVYLRSDNVDWQNAEFIILDEPNRAHPKVVNTLYELIQFHTINGQHFPKLRAIWATMNPPDGEYLVETLDASFVDRFHCIWNVEAGLNRGFFQSKFSFINDDVFADVYKWWNSIPEPTRDKNVSPRRVEYALEVFSKGGNVEYSIPKSCNPLRLQSILQAATGQKVTAVNPQSVMMTIDEAASFLNDIHLAMEQGSPIHMDKVQMIHRVPDEALTGLFNKNTKGKANNVAIVFQEHWEKLSVSPDILIALCKNAGINREIQARCCNKLCDRFPSLAKACHVTRRLVANAP